MSIREFVGVYREVKKPNQRIPVFKQGNSHVDFFDRKINISKMVEVKPEVSLSPNNQYRNADNGVYGPEYQGQQ